MQNRLSIRSGIAAAILGLVMTMVMSGVAQAADVRLKIAGTWPVKHFGHEIMENMVKEIEDAGVGLKVKYFPASQLGSGEELVEDAIRGNIDMVQAFIYAQADPRLEIMNLPALVTTFDEMKEIYGDPESNLNTLMRDIMGDLGLTYLSLVGEGLVGVVAEKKPEDPNGMGDKGMNIRVWSSEIAKKTTESLGYRTTTMNWAEVLPALQSGVIDGAICCTPEWAYTTFAVAGIGKYFVPVNTVVEASAIYASSKTWEKLNEAQQAVLLEASQKAATTAIDMAWERSQGFVEQMKEAGWEILDFTDAERTAMVDHIKSNVWPELSEVIGQETMNKLLGAQ